MGNQTDIFYYCRPGTNEETCIPWVESTNQQVDLIFNIFFMVFFIIRVSILFPQALVSIANSLVKCIFPTNSVLLCLSL